NMPYCLKEQIRCLDYRNQDDVLGRRFDASYLTGGYAVSNDLSEQMSEKIRYAILSKVNTAYKVGFLGDTAYGSRVIRRIRNRSNALSCEVQVLIHRIFHAGYGVCSQSSLIFKCLRFSS
nr:hypothetical protein [Tanacetum cinerariifolium]